MTNPSRKPFKKKPYYNIYKPLAKDGAGAALQFSYDPDKQGIFLEAANQNGPRLPIGAKDQFNWDNKIVFKIGTGDIGPMLLVFSGRENKMKSIHKPVSGNHISVFEIEKQTGKYDNYHFKLSKTEENVEGEKKTRSVGLYVNHEEMAILAHFIRESLTRMLGFN